MLVLAMVALIVLIRVAMSTLWSLLSVGAVVVAVAFVVAVDVVLQFTVFVWSLRWLFVCKPSRTM